MHGKKNIYAVAYFTFLPIALIFWFIFKFYILIAIIKCSVYDLKRSKCMYIKFDFVLKVKLFLLRCT